jgi:hypothetical protein
MWQFTTRTSQYEEYIWNIWWNIIVNIFSLGIRPVSSRRLLAGVKLGFIAGVFVELNSTEFWVANIKCFLG